MSDNKIRVIFEGNSIMVDNLQEAQNLANEHQLDLVEVGENVYKIMNYSKYIYEQQKRAKKQQPKTEYKDAQFNLGIASSDLHRKIRDIEKWLSKGFCVRIIVKLRGREQTRPEMGEALMNTVLDSLVQSGVILSKPNINTPQQTGSRDIVAIVKPIKS